MSTVCVLLLKYNKIQFDNTSTCKYSIIFTLCSVAMLPLHVWVPSIKNSGSAPGLCLCC